jgi:hypothetical protein
MTTGIRRIALIAGMVAVADSALGAQLPTYAIHHDEIHGHVTADSGRAIAGAVIAVTMAPDRVTQFDTTGADGAYAVTFDKGTGDYLVHAEAATFKTARKRVTRTGDDSLFTVDFALQPAAQKLAAVTTTASRPKPTRGGGGAFGPEGGNAEQQVSGINGQVSPDQAGNLDALAATLPGVSNIPGGGISVLGLPADQNQTTLNGMAFGGASIPRGASTSTTVATSDYDAARGGFSGAQTQVTLSSGNFLTSRTAYVTLDAPQLQATDAVGRRTGARFTNIDLNYGTNGDIHLDKWFFNTGIEASRRYSDVTSLLTASPDVLRAAGIAADSASRLVTTLGTLGVPLTTSAVPSSLVTDKLSFIGRIDRPAFDYKNFQTLNTTWGVLGYANWQRTGAMNMSPLTTAAHAGESQRANLGGQALYSAFFGKHRDRLTEFRTSLSLASTNNDPYLLLPDGSVRIASQFADGTSGIAGLSFGGNSGLQSSVRQLTWETTNQTQFYWKGTNRHRVELSGDARFDAFHQDIASNRLGAFTFNSLADLASNQPASFSRTLNAPARTGGAWNGAFGVSDYWHPSSRFTLVYGARADATAFSGGPRYNPQVDQVFGVRTDARPNEVVVSPRVGFTWTYSHARNNGMSMSVSPLGVFMSPPRGVIRGGIGEFRNLPDPMLLASASGLTGLPDDATRFSCVGSAVPVPDWSMYANDPSSIPTECVGGPGASTFSDAAPSVLLFDRDYASARAWRANLSWTSVFHKWFYSLDAITSLNLAQPSLVDLNFRDTPQFTIDNEDSRPVYVPIGSIVPGSGQVSATDARSSDLFSQVLERKSDLRSWARQATFRLTPPMPSYKYVLSATYTYTQVRALTRGFDGATFGDPTAASWSRGDYAPTHEFTLQAGISGKWLSSTLFGKFSSGLPFTPRVASDINGDGFANDRAFVFDPAASNTDAVVAAGMQALLTSAPDNVRRCLMSQRGNAAERNSCVSPWTASMNASLQAGASLRKALHLPTRVNVTLNLANPLGGLDQLLHGNDLHGWGTPSLADPVLYYVKGFDPGAQRYTYQVNPRFGDTRSTNTLLRVPFRVTLDIRVGLSQSFDEQQLDRWMKPGRQGYEGPKLDSAALVKRFFSNLPKWYDEILSQNDSLLLTREQVDALNDAKAKYIARLGQHWGELAQYMAALPDNYNSADALKRETQAIEGAWAIAWKEAHESLPKILSPLQLRMLPGNAKFLFEAKEPPKGARFFMAG